MRSLAMRIVSQFPAELRRVIDGEDRLRPEGGQPDFVFDHDLDELIAAADSLTSGVHAEEEIIDAIIEATAIQRGRDAWRARSEARAMRATSSCSGCMGGEVAR